MSQEMPQVEQENTVSSALMSSEEYASIAKELSDGSYEFNLNNHERQLNYIGLHHTFDPSDPALAELENQFATLAPTSVFVEGVSAVEKYDSQQIFAQLRTMSRDEVIRRHGEPMFTLWLAAQNETPENHIAIHSPEPSFEEEISEMEKVGFLQKDILSYHIFRLVPQYISSGGQPDQTSFLAYVRPFLGDFARLPNWSEETINKLGGEIIKQIDLNTPDIYHDLSDPIPWEGKTFAASNSVAQKTSRFRDEHIVKEIIKHGGTNALVIYGYTHAVMQEPALREAFESAQT